MLKKGERGWHWGITLYTLWKTMFISNEARKMWSGAKTWASASSIKKCSIVLVSSPRLLPSQLVSSLGREKLKAMLFNLTWVPFIFNSFYVHSSIHCSSIRSMRIHSLLRLFFFKHHCNIMEGLKVSGSPWGP